MGLSHKHREEIRRGFRTAGSLLFGFITLVLIVGGTLGVSGNDPGRFGRGGAIAAYAIGAGVLFWKAKHYSGWISGFFGLTGIFNSIAVLISGHAVNRPEIPVSPTEALLVLLFCVALAVLTFPFTKPRELDRVSRALIVLAVLAFFWGAVNSSKAYVWMTASLLFFGVAAFHAMTRNELRLLGLTRKKSRKTVR